MDFIRRLTWRVVWSRLGDHITWSLLIAAAILLFTRPAESQEALWTLRFHKLLRVVATASAIVYMLWLYSMRVVSEIKSFPLREGLNLPEGSILYVSSKALISSADDRAAYFDGMCKAGIKPSGFRPLMIVRDGAGFGVEPYNDRQVTLNARNAADLPDVLIPATNLSALHSTHVCNNCSHEF